MLSVLKKIPEVGFQRIFSYVILQKILLLMIPKLALYDFFPGRTHYLSSTAILYTVKGEGGGGGGGGGEISQRGGISPPV